MVGFMSGNGNNDRKITINDIAEDLGISTTTVSRSISGKGRISEDTRRRVLEYIEEHKYKPNQLAKGLASSKTYNIGWIVPGDSTMTALPFFDQCMAGVAEKASENDYDILISLIFGDDLSGVERIIENSKVDGFILARTVTDDPCVKLLKKSGIPFVVVGSTSEKDVIQIDNDHVNACKEFTCKLVDNGLRDFAYISGSSHHIVNLSRRQGFAEGVKKIDPKLSKSLIYMDCDDETAIDSAVEDAVRKGAKSMVCSDDYICFRALFKLDQLGLKIPDDIKVASFYNSMLLDRSEPSISVIQYDPALLGRVACEVLLSLIGGMEAANRLITDYDILLKGSTD